MCGRVSSVVYAPGGYRLLWRFRVERAVMPVGPSFQSDPAAQFRPAAVHDGGTDIGQGIAGIR
jgi:hypothetical protein